MKAIGGRLNYKSVVQRGINPQGTSDGVAETDVYESHNTDILVCITERFVYNCV